MCLATPASSSPPHLLTSSPPQARAGAAAVEITPKVAGSSSDTAEPVYLAGFGRNRRATGVHDPLFARAVVIRHGATSVAIVALDLIGLPYERVVAIRRRIRAVPGENVIIASTHVHSGPDTIGLWGPSETKSGVDEQYMALLSDRVVEAVEKAAKALRPVTLRVGSALVPDGFVKNARDPYVQDKTLTVAQLIGDDGKTVATLVNYASHPEVLMSANKEVTADFCGYMLRRIATKLGGVGVYLNGALGGMVTPDVPEHSFFEAHRVGEGIAAAALRALIGRQPAPIARLSVQSRALPIPLENAAFRTAVAAGLLKGTLTEGALKTEVTRLDLGDLTLVTVPGELLPRPGLALRERIPATHRMIVGLGNDELGYILDPDDFDRDLYRYERSMSVGRQAWPRIEQALSLLLAPGQ
jgi:hypothetical protein